MNVRLLGVWAAWSLLGACGLARGAAAPELETYRVNLNPPIDRAVQHRDRFAVDVARRSSSDLNGTWQIVKHTATWTYAIYIRSAVSLAFHASRLRRPPLSILKITAVHTAAGSSLLRCSDC